MNASIARSTRRLVLAAVLTTAVTVGVGVPAHAAKRPATPVITAANGTVGIAQQVGLVAPSVSAASATVQISFNGAAVGQQPVELGSQGLGSFAWIPSAAGTWTFSGTGNVANAAPVSITVAPVPTRTIIFTPNQVGVGSPAVLTATVTSTGGSYVPTGTVTFSNTFSGAPFATVGLSPAGAASASARFVWTPGSIDGFRITATFNPGGGAATSSSATGNTQVLGTLPLVALRVPSSFTIGWPTAVTTLIGNALLNGTAAILVNVNGQTTYPSGSVAVQSQEATTTWTPFALGNQLLTTAFSATNNTSGTSTQWISVAPTPVADPMSVSSAATGVLSAARPTSVAGGSRLTFATASGSGAAVNLAAGGACYLVGATLVTPRRAADCTLTASSPGAGAFGPNTATFSLSVTKP